MSPPHSTNNGRAKTSRTGDLEKRCGSDNGNTHFCVHDYCKFSLQNNILWALATTRAVNQCFTSRRRIFCSAEAKCWMTGPYCAITFFTQPQEGSGQTNCPAKKLQFARDLRQATAGLYIIITIAISNYVHQSRFNAYFYTPTLLSYAWKCCHHVSAA